MAGRSVAQTLLSALSGVFSGRETWSYSSTFGALAAADRNVGDTADKNVCATQAGRPRAIGLSQEKLSVCFWYEIFG